MNQTNSKQEELPPNTQTTLWQRFSALVVLGIALALLAASIQSVIFLWERTWPIPKWSPIRVIEVWVATGLAIPIGLLAIKKALRGIFHPPAEPENEFLAKTWITCIALAWISFLFITNKFLGTSFIILWGCFALPMNGVLLLRSPLSSVFRRHRILWVSLSLLFNLAFGLISIEIGLHITKHFSNSIVFLDDETNANEYIEKQRLKPGRAIFDIVVDHRGFSDVLKKQKKGDTLVASIGGSFNVIGTPLRYHFTSVAEKRTRNLQVYCMGVLGIGLNHYPTLIRKDVLPLHPDAIVLTLFVSGLLPQIEWKESKHPLLREWFSRERSMALNIIPKIATLFSLKWAEEKTSETEKNNRKETEDSKKEEGPQNIKTVIKFNPWLLNPLLEKPWMKEEAFLKLETERAINSCQIGQQSYQWLRPLLQEIKKSSGDIPVLALIIPDEFQVEDSLWKQVIQRIPDWVKYRRFYPQERIQAEFKNLGIPYVDCLKALRSGPLYRDGKRHYYLNHNTHLNLRGNRVVGKLLAKLLQEQLHLKPKRKKRSR